MVAIVNRVLDKVFDFLSIGAYDQKAYHMQAFLCFVLICCSIPPMIMYALYSLNIHVLFWMGMLPQYTNLSVPLTQLCLNIAVLIVRITKPRRRIAQWTCFVVFILLGSIQVAGGLSVMVLSGHVSEDLINGCGESTLTARIESEWQRLNSFYTECRRTEGKVMRIEECPNFGTAFPNLVYVHYIEDIEMDYQCTGFCQFWSKPLFNLEADHSVRCATALGEEMRSVGYLVGLPTLIQGSVLVSVGCCLFMYDHL